MNDATVEYDLLDNDIPNSVLEELNPWIRGFLGLTADAAKQRLFDRWKTLTVPSLCKLRDALLAFPIRTIVPSEDGGFLRLDRTFGDGLPVLGDLFLPAPFPRDEIVKRLQTFQLQNNQPLIDFLFCFGGLAESYVYAGRLLYNEPNWPAFNDSWNGKIRNFEEWRDSLMLYHACEGSFVLIRADGIISWWMMQEWTVEKYADCVEEFIEKFTLHLPRALPYEPCSLEG